MTVEAMQDRIFETQSFPQVFPYRKFRQPVLFAPHPDDEVYGCGGLLAMWVDAGLRPQVVIITAGQAQGQEPEREAESQRAASLLGGYAIDFWHLTDREVRCTPELVQRIADFLRACKADIALVPSLHEPHPDHQACALATLWSLAGLSQEVDLCFYESGAALVHCTHVVDISRVAEMKKLAMQAFSSQENVQPYSSRIAALNHFRALTLGPMSQAAEGLHWLPLAQNGWAAMIPALDPLFLHHRGQAIMQEDLPLISVIIRTIGDPRLEQAVASVLAQSYQRLEIVVVSANGMEQIPAWLSTVVCVRWVSEGRHLSRPEAANTGLNHATGELCIFLDEDDFFNPGHIEKLALTLKRNPASLAAHTDTLVINEHGHEVLRYDQPVQAQRLIFANTLPIHCVLFSRSLVYEKGCYFDINFPVLEDWDFWLQVSVHTGFSYVSGCSAIYRYSDRSHLRCDPSHSNHHTHMRQQVILKWLSLLPLEKIVSAGAWYAQQLDEKEQLLGHAVNQQKLIQVDLNEANDKIQGIKSELSVCQQTIKSLMISAKDHDETLEVLGRELRVSQQTLLNWKTVHGAMALAKGDLLLLGSIDRCVICNGILLLQGWIIQDVSLDSKLKLLYVDGAGDIHDLDIPYNRARHDVEAKLKLTATQMVSGFFFYSTAPEGKLLKLCACYNGSQYEIFNFMNNGVNAKSAGNSNSLFKLTQPWLYLMKRSWTLLKSGQFRGFLYRAKRHMSTVSSSAVFKKLPVNADGNNLNNEWDCLIFDHDMGGGANIYRSSQLMQEVFPKHDSRVALVSFSLLFLQYVVYQINPNNKKELVFQGSWSEIDYWFSKCKATKIIINNLVSFPQAFELTKTLANYVRKNKCNLTIAMHDYFAVCPSQHLQHASGNFCNVPDFTICNSCLISNEQAMVSLYRQYRIEEWRESWLNLLELADEVRVFDKSAFRILDKAYPKAGISLVLKPHIVKSLTSDEKVLVNTWQDSKHRKSSCIGVVGSITSTAKGAEVVSKLAHQIEASRKPYRIVVIGDCMCKSSKNLHVTGFYEPSDLTRLVIKHDIDLFFFPSTVPETFSYVLHELLRYKLPVAAFNLGAQSSVLSTYSLGVQLELSDSAQDVLEKIEPFIINS